MEPVSDSDECSYIPSLIAPEDQSTDARSKESGFAPQPRVHYNNSSLSSHSDSLSKLIECTDDKSNNDEPSDDEASFDEYAPRVPPLEMFVPRSVHGLSEQAVEPLDMILSSLERGVILNSPL